MIVAHLDTITILAYCAGGMVISLVVSLICHWLEDDMRR